MRSGICILLIVLVAGVVGCSKRMVVPGVLTGVGAAALVGGVAYRAALPESDSEGLLGRKPEQKAGISILLFSGIALVLAGVIWSATAPVCEKNADCWAGDVCETNTRTCVPQRAESSKYRYTNNSIGLLPKGFSFELKIQRELSPLDMRLTEP